MFECSEMCLNVFLYLFVFSMVVSGKMLVFDEITTPFICVIYTSY